MALTALLVAVLVFIWWAGLEGNKRREIKEKVAREFDTALQSGGDIHLSSFGGVAWDYICVSSSESYRKRLAGSEDLPQAGSPYVWRRLMFINLEGAGIAAVEFPPDVGIYEMPACVEGAGAVLREIPKEKAPSAGENYSRYVFLTGIKAWQENKK